MMLVAALFAACNGGSKSANTDSTATSSSDTSSVNKDTSTVKTDSMVNNAPDTVKAK